MGNGGIPILGYPDVARGRNAIGGDTIMDNGKMVDCPRCDGDGDIVERRELEFRDIHVTRMCPNCHGTGQIPSTDDQEMTQ